MECHEEAVSLQAPQPTSDTGRGRDECLRVNTAPDERLAGDKGRQAQDSHAARTAHLTWNTTSSVKTV